MSPLRPARLRVTGVLARRAAVVVRRRDGNRRATAVLAVGALVLGLVQPLAPTAAIADDGSVPEWAVQGATTRITDDGTDYLVHTYSTVGTDTFEVPAGVQEVEYLVVGGGGAGGARGGGGGGGGVVQGTEAVGSSETWRHGDVLTVEVGAGGSAPVDEAEKNGVADQSGSNSILGLIEAIGGGNGGNEDDNRNGADGGSGGGGGHYGSEQTFGGTGEVDQGSTGGGNGNFTSEPWPAGGGGGAGATGGDGTNGGTAGVQGGNGGEGGRFDDNRVHGPLRRWWWWPRASR